jgi:hypothetical protein
VKVIREGLERSGRFLVAIRTDSREMYGGVDIDRGRGRMNQGQTPQLARPLRLTRAVNPPALEAKEGLGHGETSIS